MYRGRFKEKGQRRVQRDDSKAIKAEDEISEESGVRLMSWPIIDLLRCGGGKFVKRTYVHAIQLRSTS